MSTTAWIIVAVVVVLIAAGIFGLWKRRRDEREQSRMIASAHRENAELSERRAAEAQANAERLATDAAQQREAAMASRRQAEDIDPDATPDDEPETRRQEAESTGQSWR